MKKKKIINLSEKENNLITVVLVATAIHFGKYSKYTIEDILKYNQELVKKIEYGEKIVE